MKRYALLPIVTAVVVCIFSSIAMAGNASNWSWSYDSNGINFDNGEVVIHGNDGMLAHITPDGELIIKDKTIAVTSPEKQQLIQYVSAVKDIEIKGEQLGKDAAGFATSIVANVLSGLFTGEDEDKIDKQANARAQTFKQKALPICKDVQDLKGIQDRLAASIVAFQPYAVIKDTDAHECEQDIISDD